MALLALVVDYRVSLMEDREIVDQIGSVIRRAFEFVGMVDSVDRAYLFTQPAK